MEMKIRGMSQLTQFWQDIDDKYSYDNIGDLRQQKYIPFIGSGMSVPFGYRDWSGFLSSVVDEYYDPNDKEHIEFDRLLAEGEYLSLAEKINILLNNGIAEEVRKGFHRSKMATVPAENNYLRLLCEAGIKTFVTTNFDCVIEENAEIPVDSIYLPSTLIMPGDTTEAIRTGKGGLIKLHGTWDKPESIILTKAEFDKAYSTKNTAITETIDYLWNSSVLLFLGCGLKKDYLIDKMFHLSGSGKQNWHYAILAHPNTDIKKVRRDLIQLKIRPIWFEDGKFDQIQVILKIIASADNPEPDDTEEEEADSSLLKGKSHGPATELKAADGKFPPERLKYLDHLAAQVRGDRELQNALVTAIFSQSNNFNKNYLRKGTLLDDLWHKIISSKSNYPLSIEGEPGTGKSTLLSLLFTHCLELEPSIQAFLIDTHFYDHEMRTDAAEDLRQYLVQINDCICEKRETILFIDGINRFSRGDRSLENIIVQWIEKWKVKPNIKFVLSIGVLDESLFPPFKHTSGKQPLGSKSENRIYLHPVPNTESRQSRLVAMTSYYFAEANGFKQINTQSYKDKLSLYCKKAGGTSTDFRTVNFILKLLYAAPSMDEFFKTDIGVAFNRYFHTINSEETMLATAKYTARSLLQKKSRKPIKFYYLFKSEAIRNFFFAYYYISLIKNCDVQNLKLFDCIFTPGINRFAVDLMLNEPDHGRRIINNIQKLMENEAVTTSQKNQMAFLLGRVTNKVCREISIEILSKEYKEWDWNKRMTNSMAMYIRTVGISLIYLGSTIYASDFYEKLIYNGFLSKINRNFHIQYFITKGYRFDSTLKLDDTEMCSAENIDGLYQYIYHSILDKNSRGESMCINIITILNLTVYKIFCLGKNSDTDIQKAQKLIEILLSEKVNLSNSVVLEYVHNIREYINNGNIYISTLSNIYHLKEEPRAGWIKRGVDKRIPVESVADHTWACCQLALLFLPENLEDCQFAEASELSVMGNEYSLSRILQMLIIHDLGEAFTGDILNGTKSADDEKRESNAFRSLVTLDTLPHFNTFGYIDDLAKEFKERATYNAKLAKDIDLIEPLIQLFIYRENLDSYEQDGGRRERDEWVKSVETRLNTALGKNFLYFLSNQILCHF